MSLKRTPPKSSNKNIPSSYGSDSQLYVSPSQDIHSADHLENITRRMKRKLNPKPSENNSTLVHMEDMFASFESQQNSKYDKLLESILSIKEQNIEIQKSMDFMSLKYDEVLQKMSDQEQIIKSQESKITSLEFKIELLERNSRSSAIEIRNIPKQTSENKLTLRTVVKKVGELVDQPLSDSDIQDVYRIKTRNDSNNHIMVNFTTTICKDGFIRQARNYNRMNKDNKLNTSLLQLPGPLKPIFIDESLTMLGRRLAYVARQSVKENQYYGTWSSYGKIYIKKTQDALPIRIDSEQDLKKLITK